MTPNNSLLHNPIMSSLESYLRPALQTAQDALVTVVDSLQLRKDAPFSPNIPKELLESMPDLSGRLLLTFPWTKPRSVDPTQHSVWILDNTAYRVQPYVICLGQVVTLTDYLQWARQEGQQAQGRPCPQSLSR